MKRSLFTACLVFSALGVACVGGPGPLPGTGQTSDRGTGSPSSDDTSSPRPRPSDGDSDPGEGSGSGSSSSGGEVGPSCKAYLECCKTAAAEEPSFEDSCTSFEAQLDAAEDPSSFESACEDGSAGMRNAGYCQ